MDYSHGSVYGYDQIQTHPTLNAYDNPYLEVPRILRDQQYAAAAVRSTDIRPGSDNVGRYVPFPAAYKERAPIDSRTIVLRGDEGMCAASYFNDNNMLMILIFILIIIVVNNSVTLKRMRKRIKNLQNMRSMQPVIIGAPGK